MPYQLKLATVVVGAALLANVVVDGDMGANVTEWFRLKDGRIVEHWDTFQVMDPKVKARNPHPYF